MNIKQVAEQVLVALEELSTEERKEKTRYFAPTARRVVGVSNPDMRLVIKELKKEYSHWSSRDWISLSKELVKMSVFECQVVAYELIAGSRKLLDALEYGDLEALQRNLDNWASVDHFTVGIYGVLWGKGVVKDGHIDRLLESENVWDRRVGVVSTVALNTASRGGTGDTGRTLSVCERVVHERHPMIRKALSWALRSLIRWDREAVYGFLETHRGSMSAQVVREVSHKLEYGTKN